MSNQIRHDGTIVSIEDNHIRVHIVQTSACASCKAASKCMASESKVKIIDVWTDNYDNFDVGDAVVVETENRIGIISVVLGFVLPIVFLLTGVIITLTVLDKTTPFENNENANQAVAAVVGLLMLVPYYIGLYFFRNKINSKIYFTIRH